MKGTVKTLRFFAWPLAQMLGVATLFYFGTLVLGGLTKMVIFSDYAISFCFLYGIFLYISFWQFSAAYSQRQLSFGATRAKHPPGHFGALGGGQSVCRGFYRAGGPAFAVDSDE